MSSIRDFRQYCSFIYLGKAPNIMIDRRVIRGNTYSAFRNQINKFGSNKQVGLFNFYVILDMICVHFIRNFRCNPVFCIHNPHPFILVFFMNRDWYFFSISSHCGVGSNPTGPYPNLFHNPTRQK